MPLRKEPCRNFQRGSCRFGDKCKFLHVTHAQQQPKQNAFGFGSQTGMPFQQSNLHHHNPNPFGFGVQSSIPANGQHSHGFKPFENKWTRSEQPSNQSQGANHTCTEPDSCKRLIAEDFQQERPLWKLTCYGHYKYLPCDITGDISYEELRATAYDEAKRGINLQAIVERERNLLNSKLAEFENLLRNPYTRQTHPAQANQHPFPAVRPTTSSLTAQNTGPPVSSFGQLGSSQNMAFGVRTGVPSNTGFGQFQGSSGRFGATNTPSGPFGSQIPVQGANPFTSNSSGFGSNGMSNQGSQLPSISPVSPQIQTSPFNQSPVASNAFGATTSSNAFGATTASNAFGTTNGAQQMSANDVPVNNTSHEVSAADASIWLKEEWKLGEIPEQPPPAAFVR